MVGAGVFVGETGVWVGGISVGSGVWVGDASATDDESTVGDGMGGVVSTDRLVNWQDKDTSIKQHINSRLRVFIITLSFGSNGCWKRF